MNKGAVKKREIWVDDVKVIACILVVLGHFFQSMIKACILPENNLYTWFNNTIYYFHVPLFFICSGYLYQRYSRVNSVESWGKNVLKKALVLGVPYFTFSFAVWLLKTVFSSNVNDQIGGIVDVLFFHPTSPYWYLYALFFIFLITPTFKDIWAAVTGFAVAILFKAILLIGGGYSIYAISTVLSNEIWFVGGMCLAVIAWNPLKIWISGINGIVFAVLSVLLMNVSNGWISFGMGAIACVAVVETVRSIDESRKQNVIFSFLSKYTMPIFVMHTLFAAPLRTVLFKVGVSNAGIHVVGGIAISFIGPIIAAEIMKKTKVLEFFLYPGKFIKVK